MDEKLSELLEGLSDWDRGKRSGAHWGGGGAQRGIEPMRNQHPLDGVRLGVQDPITQAELAAEFWLTQGPGGLQPRLKPQDGSWMAFLYPASVGALDGLIKGFYYSLGNRIWPDRRTQPLAWNAFADLAVLVAVPQNGQVTNWKNSERRRVIANDHHGFYLNTPATIGGPECREYAVSFAFPRK